MILFCAQGLSGSHLTIVEQGFAYLGLCKGLVHIVCTRWTLAKPCARERRLADKHVWSTACFAVTDRAQPVLVTSVPVYFLQPASVNAGGSEATNEDSEAISILTPKPCHVPSLAAPMLLQCLCA